MSAVAWFGLIGTVVWNYTNHRHGRTTICAVTRRAFPRRAIFPALFTGAGLLGVHLRNGYPKEASWPASTT